MTVYLDEKTFLPQREETAGPLGNHRSIVFSAWRDFAGVKFPGGRIVPSTGDPNFDIVIMTEQVEINIPLAAGLFAKPAETAGPVHFDNPTQQVVIPVGTTSLAVAKNVVLSLPGVELPMPSVTVLDASAGLPLLGHRWDGLLGDDVLSRLVVRVNYEHKEITVYDPAVFVRPDRAAVREDPPAWARADRSQVFRRYNFAGTKQPIR